MRWADLYDYRIVHSADAGDMTTVVIQTSNRPAAGSVLEDKGGG